MTHIDPQVENLETSDLRFFTTFNQAAVGIAHVSQFGRLLRVNQKFCEIVGYKREELMTKSFQDITYPDDLQQDLEAASTLMAGKIEAYTMEKRYIRKNGAIVWVSLTVSSVRPPGQLPYFISVITDINARKQGEEALHEAHLQVAREREFARMERDSFFNLAQDCMAVTDLQGYFVRVNPSFCHLLGYTEVELTTRPARFFMHPDDVDGTLKYRTALLTGKSKGDRFENRFVAKDGTPKWISWTGRNIPGVGNYITGRDITELKAEELAAKQRQVMMQTNLKLNAIGMMAANMAHEINNPLTIIFGEGCMLRKMVEQKKVELQKLERIAENIVKMSERIVR
jgi:PAS domain S-box-containing protein